jgi:YVTN family beta-propeller protein
MKLASLAFAATAALLLAQQEQPVLLDNGWRLRPAGHQLPLSSLPLSAALSPDGKYLVTLNAGSQPAALIVLDTAAEREISRAWAPDAWLGLTFSRKGDRLYVGGGSQAAVFEFLFSEGKLTAARTFPVTPPDKRTRSDFIGDVTFDPAGRLLYSADLFRNSIAVINPQSGRVIDRYPTGRRPYRILFAPDGKSFFVSSWADGTVYQHETEKGAIVARLRLGPHPTDMLWLEGKPKTEEEGQLEWVTARLFVAAANTNNVYVLGVSETGELRQIETINVSLTPWQPAGMTPSALALSADGRRLLVACSDVNAVAVVDITGARGQVLGFIPTGRYPTAVRALAGDRLAVLNGYAPSGPLGSISFIERPTGAELDEDTRAVLASSPYSDNLLEDAGTGKDSPIPARPGDPTPIQHVIYILMESNLGGANQSRLAREFVRLDHFEATGAPGPAREQWATAAIASDFVAKMQPRPFEYEGGEPAAVPPSAYLWTNAVSAGLTVRSYGLFVVNRPLKQAADGVEVQLVRDPVLNRITNRRFRGPDPQYPDAERVKVFVEDLAGFERSGQMPSLILMRLSDDSALGRVVEAVSKSRFWASAAIFASPGLVISPYVKRGSVDGAMYNTTSMLRTMELILGLRPMTVFDAGARPMTGCFRMAADPRPYAATHSNR